MIRNHKAVALALAGAIFLAASPAFAGGGGEFRAQIGLPNPTLTPGATNPDVTQDTIDVTICLRGWTKTVRPPISYTNPLKRRLIAAYGYTATDPRLYELDHFIPLELGGHPTDPKNLWPEPWADPWGAKTKDQFAENTLHADVCAGRLSLIDAQKQIQQDWRHVSCQHGGPPPCPP
jgi:hypothetical protein